MRSCCRRLLLRATAALAGGLTARPRVAATSADRRVVEVALEARSTTLAIGGEEVSLLTYNGLHPGPLIRAAEGDLLRVTLANALDEPTNLHFHGLHVPPSGSGDNVFIEVPPGGRHTYELTVPEGHGGTFWYHPHRHHRLARQLWRGLAGPLVVDRPEDALPELAAADEHVVVVKDLSVEGGRPAEHTAGDWARGKSGRLVLANGVPRPVLGARASLVRLRLVNACNARALLLGRGDDRPFHLIAHEGHLLEAPQELAETLVAPAQRVDLLLALEPGEPLALVHKPYNRGARREPSGTEALLTISPPAEHRPLRLPSRLAAVERLDPAAATRTRRFRMAMAFMAPDGHGHLAPLRARLGDLELWDVTNVDTQDHVFHLHTWPFQVWRRALALSRISASRLRRATARARLSEAPSASSAASVRSTSSPRMVAARIARRRGGAICRSPWAVSRAPSRASWRSLAAGIPAVTARSSPMRRTASSLSRMAFIAEAPAGSRSQLKRLCRSCSRSSSSTSSRRVGTSPSRPAMADQISRSASWSTAAASRSTTEMPGMTMRRRRISPSSASTRAARRSSRARSAAARPRAPRGAAGSAPGSRGRGTTGPAARSGSGRAGRSRRGCPAGRRPVRR